MKRMSQDYRLGTRVLDDIQDLTDRELHPLVQQAQFHFDGLRNLLDQKKNSMEGLDSINRLLFHYFEITLNKFFFRNDNVFQMNTSFDRSSMSLARWNRLVESLPYIVSLAEIFDFSSVLNISLNTGVLKVSGDVKDVDGVLEKRSFVYSLFRNLCSKRVLATYNVSERKHRPCIELIFDLRDDDALLLSFDFDQNKNVGLNYLLSFYNVGVDEFVNISKNKTFNELSRSVFYLDDNFFLSPFGQVLKDFENLTEDCEIYHFCFLFRTLSIIIPRRAEIRTFESFSKVHHVEQGSQNISNTGSVFNSNCKHEVCTSEREIFYIDLMKFLTDS